MTTHRLFVTGTDTGVGKTHFTAWFARQLQRAGLKVGAYKPVCSGSVVRNGETTWDDADQLAAALDDTWPREHLAPQCFHAPLAPPVAASLEGGRVDESLLISGAEWWDGRVDVLLVEGAGGWLSPVSGQWTNADLAARLQSPVVLVAGNRLGVINHALLSIAAIRQTCELLGVVLNQLAPDGPTEALPGSFDPVQSNAAEIERRGDVRLWGVLTHGDHPELVSNGVRIAPDWKSVLRLGSPV